MSVTTFLLAVVSILLTTIGQAMLKHGMDRIGGFSGGQPLSSVQQVVTEPFILAGLALIIVTIPMWLEVLSRLPLSIAHPMVSIGYVISVGIGVMVFKESVTPLRILGVVLV